MRRARRESSQPPRPACGSSSLTLAPRSRRLAPSFEREREKAESSRPLERRGKGEEAIKGGGSSKGGAVKVVRFQASTAAAVAKRSGRRVAGWVGCPTLVNILHTEQEGVLREQGLSLCTTHTPHTRPNDTRMQIGHTRHKSVSHEENLSLEPDGRRGDPLCCGPLTSRRARRHILFREIRSQGPSAGE